MFKNYVMENLINSDIADLKIKIAREKYLIEINKIDYDREISKFFKKIIDNSIKYHLKIYDGLVRRLNFLLDLKKNFHKFFMGLPLNIYKNDYKLRDVLDKMHFADELDIFKVQLEDMSIQLKELKVNVGSCKK